MWHWFNIKCCGTYIFICLYNLCFGCITQIFIILNMIIEKKQIADLIPAPYNPRQSTAKQEKHLKESLEKFGMVEPIIFNKQTGYIVGGHFRVRELKKLGIKEIECVIVDLNEEDEKELNIRLNANTGSWDWDTLANDWDVVDLEAWGLEIPQFDERGEIDYSDKNQEIDVEELEGLMTINLKYTEEDYWKVKEQLSKVAHTPEQAVWKLLRNE